MANKILQRRGLKANMPNLSSGEIGYATDTRETFIGTGSGNVNMGGSHWYRGTAMSGTSTTANAYSYAACPEVKLDDIYMNISNCNIYACTTAGSGTTAKWTYQGCIKGATGATGETGATGAAGADGQDLQAVYSTTPTQIGTWIDGKAVYRAAWEFTCNGSSSIIYQYQDIPNAPFSANSGEPTVLRSSFAVYYNDYSHIITDIDTLNTFVHDSSSRGLMVYCIVDYLK